MERIDTSLTATLSMIFIFPKGYVISWRVAIQKNYMPLSFFKTFRRCCMRATVLKASFNPPTIGDMENQRSKRGF